MLKEIRFGIEIETINSTRDRVAAAIQSIVGGSVRHIGSPYCFDPYHITDRRGRTWRVMADSSLSAPKHLQAEIVSPILEYSDIEELQEIVRAVRTQAKAKMDVSSGVHLHIDGSRFDAKSIVRLVKIVNKNEDLIFHALGTSASRKNRWCKGVDQDFLKKIEKRSIKSLRDINTAWYGRHNSNPMHYDSSRYHALNLNSFFYLGTIEFRLFNNPQDKKSLHAGRIKAWIQFTLALAAKALTGKAASSKKREFNPATAKYDMRVLTIKLGLIGEEYKTCRHHLLLACEGCSAWKHGRPQERIARGLVA